MGTDRVQILSVPTDGGPNTLSDMMTLDETHGKTREEKTDLTLAEEELQLLLQLSH
jgi:hypothetical protein